jgi:hypothetical protein
MQNIVLSVAALPFIAPARQEADQVSGAFIKMQQLPLTLGVWIKGLDTPLSGIYRVASPTSGRYSYHATY